MKATIALFSIGLTIATNAAVVTYNFNTGLNDSTAGGALTAGDISYAIGTQSDGAPAMARRAWDQTSAPGNYLLNFGQRGLGNSGTDDAVLTMANAATLRFTLTPKSGGTLDFSSSTLSFDQSIYLDSIDVRYGYKIWADTGGGFEPVGTRKTTALTYTAGTEKKLLKTDETNDLPGFYLTDGIIQSKDTTFNFDLSSLEVLATNQSVTLAIAISSSKNNQNSVGSTFDNLVLNVDVPPSAPTAPIALDDTYDIQADINFTNTAPGILRNDTDINWDALVASLVSSPTNGTLLSFSTNGAFVYQPSPSFEGTDTFTYEAIDTGGLTGNVATVTLTITMPPTTQELLFNGDLQIGVPTKDKADSFTCKWWRRKLASETAWNVWLTDQWPVGAENQAFQYSWGTAFTYQYFSALAGESYDFSCENLNSGDTRNRWNAQIRVEWYDANDTRIGSAETIAQEDNLTSPSGEWNLLTGSTTAPENTAYGRIMLGVKNNGNPAGTYWQDTFIDNASVIGVAGTNNLPCSFISAPYDLRLNAIPESTLYTDTLTNYAEDKDGDTLIFSTLSKPDWLTISPNGAMTGTPLFENAGENELVVTVEDGHGHSDTNTVKILVLGFLNLANLFDHDIVLQRNKPIPVMGTAISNTTVTVNMSTGESASTTSGTNGNWELTLPPIPATTNGAVTLTVTSGSRALTVTNVLIGDVWLCSGQSNMDFKLNSSDGAAAEITGATYPNLHFITTPATKGTNAWTDLDARAVWKECTPTTAGSFSAVAYYFGKELMLDLNIPIGLINSSQGGTSIEGWAPSLNTPGSETFYNSRVHPYTQMPIRGAIWYQAEANVGDGSAYTPKMQTLVDDWRTVWGSSASEFPFYFVQLAPYNYSGDTVYKLPEIWAAQTEAMRLITNSGMAVVNDVGNISNIHPSNKEPVGKRLALWAKYGTYGQTNLVHSGPLAREVNREGSQLRVSFEYVESGLVSRDGLPLNWFEIAGTNQMFVTATTTVDGDTILVSAPAVAEPEWVRFAWHEIAEPNLMNVEGLPAGAFMERRVRPAPFQGELLLNGNFEIGTPTSIGETTFEAPPWERFIVNGKNNSWLTDNSFKPVIGADNQAVEITWGGTYIHQDFPVIGRELYRLSVDVLNPTDANNKWTPQLHVKWFDASSNVVESALLDQANNASDPYGVWFELDGSAVAPDNAATGRIQLIVDNTNGDNDSYFFDNASVVGPLEGITFENWAIGKSIGEPLDDGDLDRALNLEEYAFNLDPSVPDWRILVPTIGNQGLPYISLTNAHLQVEYIRRKETDDLTYSVQISTNLTDWTTNSITTSISSINAEWERVVEIDPIPANDASTRFIRIQTIKK